MTSCLVRTRLWRDGKLVAQDFPLSEVSDHINNDNEIVWADLLHPDEEALDQLAEELSLDRHAIEDAATVHERPKAVRYQSHLFVTAFAINNPGPHMTISRVSAFVSRHYLVTVRLGNGFDIDAVLRRWDENSDMIQYGTRALFYEMLDFMVDTYIDAVERLDDEIEGLEDELFDENPKVIAGLQKRTFLLRQRLTKIRKVILPMRDVITVILRRVITFDRTQAMLPYYEDLEDHILRAAEWTEGMRDTLTSVYETNLSLADTRMNTIMKKLTAWAAIIAVPTAITGFYGQNVPYPGFGREWGFALSATSILLIAGVLYLTFKRRDWL